MGGPPWPQAAEIAQVIPSEQWTLIGGLMVQLHAVRAGVPPTRATVDVDMILHIETGAATFGGVRARLEQIGYELQMPVRGAGAPFRTFGWCRAGRCDGRRPPGTPVSAEGVGT